MIVWPITCYPEDCWPHYFPNDPVLFFLDDFCFIRLYLIKCSGDIWGDVPVVCCTYARRFGTEFVFLSSLRSNTECCVLLVSLHSFVRDWIEQLTTSRKWRKGPIRAFSPRWLWCHCCRDKGMGEIMLWRMFMLSGTEESRVINTDTYNMTKLTLRQCLN
jgi:hypothetical protein